MVSASAYMPDGNGIHVVSGSGYLMLPLTNRGVIKVDSGWISHADGTTFQDGTILTGAGTNLLDRGTVILDGDIRSDNGEWFGATLAANGSVKGVLTWKGGMFAPGSRLAVAEDGVLRISGIHSKVVVGALVNFGTVTANTNVFVCGLIENFGVFDLLDNSCVKPGPCAGGTFKNNGVVRKSLLPGENCIEIPMTNAGIIEVSLGTLHMTSGYSQTSTGRIRIGIGGSTASSQHGKVNVGGPAGLNGTFEALLSDGFHPSPGESFEVLSYTTRQGEFANYALPEWQFPLSLGPFYSEHALTLRVGDFRPKLGPLSKNAAGQMEFSVSALDGRSYTIEASTNLVVNSWITLTNLPPGPGVFRFSDPATANYDRRFYRAILR